MVNIENISGIIFDYGGTIDSRGVHWSEVIWQAYQKANLGIDKNDFRDAYVFAERELAKVKHIYPHHNFYDLLEIKMRIELTKLSQEGLLDVENVEEKTLETARYCYQAAKECIEEARPILEKLAAKYPMVLVSNFYGNVEAVLRDFDLLKYFDKIIESAVVGVGKPDPEIFRLGVDALNMPATSVVVIGDSYKKDILPARSLGCATLWLKGKGWTAEEDAVVDSSIITSLNEVAEILCKK